MAGVSDPVAFLVRRRPVIALAVALLAGGFAFASVRDAEPFLEADVSLPVGGRERSLYTVVLRARGGGAITEIEATCDDPRASIPLGRFERLGPGEASRVRVDLSGDGDGHGPATLRVTYKNPDPRTLDVKVGRK